MTPTVFSNLASYFFVGESIPAGTYTISYVSGAVKWYSGFSEWTVGTEDYEAEHDGYYIVYNGGTATAKWPETADVSTDAAVAATQAGLSVVINHTGGTIAMVMQDTNYSDNVISATYGAPTFAITPCGSSCDKPYNTGQSVYTGEESELECDTDRQWNYNGSPAAAPSSVWTGYGPSNTTNYRWIGAQCDGKGQASGNTNLNTTSFVIPLGVRLSTYELIGQWSADNYLDSISVNGTSIDIGNFTSVSGVYGTVTGYTSVHAYCVAMSVSTPDYSFSQLWPFSIPEGSNFQAGTNTLTFAVWGDDSLGGLLVIWDHPCDIDLASSSSSSMSSVSSISSSSSSSSEPSGYGYDHLRYNPLP